MRPFNIIISEVRSFAQLSQDRRLSLNVPRRYQKHAGKIWVFLIIVEHDGNYPYAGLFQYRGVARAPAFSISVKKRVFASGVIGHGINACWTARLRGVFHWTGHKHGGKRLPPRIPGSSTLGAIW